MHFLYKALQADDVVLYTLISHITILCDGDLILKLLHHSVQENVQHYFVAIHNKLIPAENFGQ